HIEILQRDVMDELIVRPLKEGGINRDDRLLTLARQAGGEGDCVLLRDADIEISVGKASLELDHAAALAHGGSDTEQSRIALRHVAEPLPEHLGECGAWRRCGLLNTDVRI